MPIIEICNGLEITTINKNLCLSGIIAVISLLILDTILNLKVGVVYML